MKIYLAGPMTGIVDLNFPVFNAEAKRLRELGYEVVNPAEINPDATADWLDCMLADIPQLMSCDGIAMLPGWTKSRGARVEYCIAQNSSKSILIAALITDPPPRPAELKASNPKDAVAAGKLPLHLWPTTATAMGALGLLDGMLKYGRSNWRVAGVRASVYVDAIQRHLHKWFEGQENDTDSGLPHFAHMLACIAILVDAELAGKLIDDRMVAGGYLDVLDTLTAHVGRLKNLHADKAPRHYTIADSAAHDDSDF